MDEFIRIGNHPAADLCNTTPVLDGTSVELLPDGAALARWAAGTGIAAAPDDPDGALAFVHRLRAAVRAALTAPAPDPGLDAAVNRVLAERPAVVHVDTTAADPVGLAAVDPADRFCVELAAAVVDVFRHDRRLVRTCAGPACVLVFLDASRSGRRRWCDMAACGNRAKAAAHYARGRPTRS